MKTRWLGQACGQDGDTKYAHTSLAAKSLRKRLLERPEMRLDGNVNRHLAEINCGDGRWTELT